MREYCFFTNFSTMDHDAQTTFEMVETLEIATLLAWSPFI